MALRVWLPLNGTLENKGISEYTFSSSNYILDDNGKIGKCYKHLNCNITDLQNLQIYPMTIAFWMKSSDTTSSWQKIIMFDNVNASQIHGIYIADSTRVKYEYSPSLNIYGASPGEWHHYAFVIDNGQSYGYYDGILSATSSETITLDTLGKIRVGEGNDIYLNDVRIYDNCLSAKEVKEISQGLILHYKLDNPYSSNNLIENGYGENGTTNWINSGRSTTEIPSGHSEIKASFYNGNMTVNYIPVISSHSYTISGYIKSSGDTSGTIYPSIYPYDIDKKFIAYYNSRIGFDLTTATTLTQPLKPGDTVIYVADLSKWNSNSGHYYNYCAIFGYKDSTGYVYPDFEYTQDLGLFGYRTNEKSNLDKQNNKITLTSAYNGLYHPAGTTVCASTEGATYYYPFGGIALSSLSDWVFKTATFIPQNDNRLRWSKYFKWSTYGKCYIAGNKLIDNTFISDIIKDSSGYENDGMITGILTIESNSNRYEISTHYSGSSYTDTGSGTFNWFDFSQCTLSAWIKSTASVSGWSGSIGVQHNQSAGHKGFTITDYANNFRVVTVNGSYTTIDSGKPLTVGEWHHCAAVLNGTNLKMYYDGAMVKESTVSWGSAAIATDMRFATGVDFPGSDEMFTGNYSDIRMYCTALSAEDILDLYHTSANIDDLGNLHGFEFVENDENKINKNGIINNNIFSSSIINNFTQTRSTQGWTLGGNLDTNGHAILVGTGPTISSDIFYVDNNDIYEINFNINMTSPSSSGDGLHLGITSSTNTIRCVYNWSSGTYTETDNASSPWNTYFVGSFKLTKDIHIKTYVVGANVNINTIKPEATDNAVTVSVIKIKSPMSVGFRAGYNTNTTMTLEFWDPSVIKINGNIQAGIKSIETVANDFIEK